MRSLNEIRDDMAKLMLEVEEHKDSSHSWNLNEAVTYGYNALSSLMRETMKEGVKA